MNFFPKASRSHISFGLVVAVALTCAGSASAANYPLEITAPRSTLPSQHRLLRAYPGLLYNIRAAVVGGAYPYVFVLSNAPAGMTINPTTGEINWPNPAANASNITLTVTDAESTQVSQSWSITVGTSGFKFVDAVNGSSGGTGAIGSPWRTLADVYSRGTGNDIVYFRAGTYTTAGLPTIDSGAELKTEFDQAARPVMWLAYPGAAPVLDFLYTSSATPRIRLLGSSIYLDGFEVTRIYAMGFQIGHSGGRGSIFRRMNMHDLLNGVDGANSAFIMTMNTGAGAEGYGMVVQDSVFNNTRGTAAALKFYYTNRLLVEDCVFTNSNGSETIAVKMRNRQFTIRANEFSAINGEAIGGNMFDGDDANDHGHYGEIGFNNVRDGTLVLNLQSEAGPTYVFRNTFQDRVLVTNTTSDDGPFTFTNNVIVNSDNGTPSGSHVHHQNVSAPSRVVLVNNLTGFPSNNIVTPTGDLTAAYASYAGTHGHLAGYRPRSPTNVRVIR